MKMTKMMVLIGVLGASLAGPLAARAQGPGSTMADLARIREGVHTERVSSWDRTGGNNDRMESIPDGERRTIFNVKGAGIIDHIWITIAPPPEQLSRNDIILRIYWDGETEPSVEAPIGPFFGQGWGESYYFVSLPLADGPLEGRGMVSYFAMPFSRSARIEIENDTGRKIDAFYYSIDYQKLDKLPADMGRFHAWYNHEVTEALATGENEWGSLGYPQGKNATGAGNYLIADIQGKGQYVGVNYYVNSPTPIWYGEGDDMFFIDGASWPPTLHGTGTEDYFNTAWSPSPPEPFFTPYYGLARVDGETGWLGRTHLYRFHVQDPVYFDRSLRFSIEHGHENNLTLDLASVAYWYQTEPHKPFPAFPSRAQRQAMPAVDMVDIHRWRDAWRKSMGNGARLWGKEQKPNPQQ
jgi:hypothetical protein